MQKFKTLEGGGGVVEASLPSLFSTAALAETTWPSEVWQRRPVLGKVYALNGRNGWGSL